MCNTFNNYERKINFLKFRDEKHILYKLLGGKQYYTHNFIMILLLWIELFCKLKNSKC